MKKLFTSLAAALVLAAPFAAEADEGRRHFDGGRHASHGSAGYRAAHDRRDHYRGGHAQRHWNQHDRGYHGHRGWHVQRHHHGWHRHHPHWRGHQRHHWY